MSQRVAITRAEPDAQRTAERVRERGGVPVLAPLLHIIPCGYDTNVEGAQALLFTSAAGVRAFPDTHAQRHLPVLTVGDATEQAARDAGFLDVRSADGDVVALAELAKTTLDPARGKLVHISGDHVAGNLAAALPEFRVERRVAYAARAAQTLPAAFSEPLDIVLFHSARAALTFVSLGAPGARRLIVGCLSPQVAEAASAHWARLIVAPKPREDALLEAVFGA